MIVIDSNLNSKLKKNYLKKNKIITKLTSLLNPHYSSVTAAIVEQPIITILLFRCPMKAANVFLEQFELCLSQCYCNKYIYWNRDTYRYIEYLIEGI
ncbi:hypothetical protein EB796_012680 [Bugula neritina]|uniref:Uncharacterized protein n=1 Tax=Bugula neritina TaxID=10212 RepID=A0A7J7JRN4_BUGNE|nr:hypothetical protein EB796_012680 [Bugula neritina]